MEINFNIMDMHMDIHAWLSIYGKFHLDIHLVFWTFIYLSHDGHIWMSM